MNSKLPPKYTILFLLLFILFSNKGEPAPLKSAKLYSAIKVIPSKAFSVYTPPSFVSEKSCAIYKIAIESDLESYRWFMNMGFHIRN